MKLKLKNYKKFNSKFKIQINNKIKIILNKKNKNCKNKLII